jgi:Spy/CpxP family protein refolding chaperone
MRLFGKLAMAFAVVVLMAAPALAQQGRGGFGGGMGGGGMLLTNKSVHAEIKATEEQVSKLTTFAEEFRGKQREAMQGLQDLSQEDRQAKMRDVMTKSQTEMNAALAGILKPEQVTRFHEIQLQQGGAQALLTPKVAEDLKLTDEQKTKVREINQEAGAQMREIFQGAADDREGAMKKMTALRKETTGKALKVLTDKQKTSYDKLLGKPFEIKLEPRPN